MPDKMAGARSLAQGLIPTNASYRVIVFDIVDAQLSYACMAFSSETTEKEKEFK